MDIPSHTGLYRFIDLLMANYHHLKRLFKSFLLAYYDSGHNKLLIWHYRGHKDKIGLFPRLQQSGNYTFLSP